MPVGPSTAVSNNLPTINQIGLLNAAGAVTQQPFRNFYRNKNGTGNVLMWQDGLDIASDIGNGLLDIFYLLRGFQDGTAGGQDVFMAADYGDPAGHAPKVAFGLGNTPPGSGYRVTAAGVLADDTWAIFRMLHTATQTGKSLVHADSGGIERFWIENSVAGGAQPLLNGNHGSYGAGIAVNRLILAPTVNSITALVVKSASGQQTDMTLWQLAGVNKMGFDSSGRLKVYESGFFQTTVGAAGAASALPATPTKYWQIKDNGGTTYVIPLYAAS